MGTRTVSQTINLQTPDQSEKYISADSSGLMIYDGRSGAQIPSSPSSTTNNVFIDENSLDVRRGTEVFATFGADSAIIGNTSSGNLLADTNGIVVRDGLTELATFGASGAQIGKDDGAHIALDSSSMTIYKDVDEMLRISTEASGSSQWTDMRVEDGDYSSAVRMLARDSNSAMTNVKAEANPDLYANMQTWALTNNSQVRLLAVDGYEEVRVTLNNEGNNRYVSLFAGEFSSTYESIQINKDDGILFSLDTTSASGTDHDLYAAITALEWQSEVIV